MYILLHFVILFLPGLVFCLGIGGFRLADLLCLSFAASLIKLTLLITLAKQFDLSLAQFSTLWAGLLLLLLGWLVSRGRRGRRIVVSADDRWDIVALLILVSLSSLYLLLAGPYLEIPSDVFAHLEYAQGALVDLADSDFTGGFKMATLSGPGNYCWYYIFALICALTSTDFQAALLPASLANVVTLMIVLFAFATLVFSAQTDRRLRTVLAFISCAIFFVTFGTNIFAFVRYYALAPTTLNMALYFSAIAILLRYVRASGVPLLWCCFIIMAMVVAWLIHEQEAIFIFVAGLCLSIYAAAARIFVKDADGSAGGAGGGAGLSIGVLEAFRIPWLVLAGLGGGALIVAVIWSHLNLDRYMVPDTKLLSLQSFLPTTRDLYILNPSRQFYQTVSLLGVIVYVLSIFHIKSIRHYPYLVAGLVSPLLTVFNPFFADLFLRHSIAESFWRFCYIIPIAFVASLILVNSVALVRRSSSFKRPLAALSLLAIVAAMVAPSKIGGFTSWTRWPTLFAADAGSAVEHWQDLIDEVSNLPLRTQLFTDPVTGYLLTGMTTAQSRRKKFHRFPHDQLSMQYLTRARLRRSQDTHLIVNLRDAEPSRNGALSRHWPAQITQTSAYYRPELLTFIDENPAIFNEVWRQDRIRIYRIMSDRL